MDLKNLKVVELNNDELTTVDGGFWWLAIAEILYEMKMHPEDVNIGRDAATKWLKQHGNI